MKICVISFDYWDYDHYIIKALRKKNVESFHIKIGSVSYDNYGEKVKNAASKIFLHKNLKDKKRQKYVIDTLEKLGYQDQILVLNPDVFTHETLSFIRKKTHRLITFLYDNLSRYPVEDKLHYFDKVFSFDDEDVQHYHFEKLCNYIYLEKQEVTNDKPSLDLFYVTSYDKNRNKVIYPLALKLKQLKSKFQIVVVGKKTWFLRWKYFFSPTKKDISVVFRRKTIDPKSILKYYQRTNTILDLMREGQTGLSFRVFEAMALEKKIITNNSTIRNYAFYNPQNILVLNDDLSNLTADFFQTPYEKIPKEIYNQYTLDTWVEKVFNLYES